MIPSPPPDWALFELGTWVRSWLPAWPAAWTLPIRTAALLVLAGVIVAILLANRRLTARGGERWVILDIAIPTVVLAVIGARTYQVLTHPEAFFPLDAFPWWNVIAIWQGGTAIFGALIGGAVGVWIGCRYTGVRFGSAVDAIAPGLLVAQALGRLGNYLNRELFGVPTDLPWGLQIERSNPAWPTGLPAGTLYSPVFLYELIWNLVGFAGLVWLTRRVALQWGRTFALYLIWYGLGRTWFESIRVDPSEYYLGIRANVWAAAIAVVLGLAIFVVQGRRHPGLEPSVYRPGKEWAPAPAVGSADRYSDTDDPDDEAQSGVAEPATSGATNRS